MRASDKKSSNAIVRRDFVRKTMRVACIIITAGIMIAAAVITVPAGSMRCGNDIVNINDNAFIILQKCGEPVSKIHVGYTTNKNQERESVIEEWVYGPTNGYYYYLIMIGGHLSEIRSEQQ